MAPDQKRQISEIITVVSLQRHIKLIILHKTDYVQGLQPLSLETNPVKSVTFLQKCQILKSFFINQPISQKWELFLKKQTKQA